MRILYAFLILFNGVFIQAQALTRSQAQKDANALSKIMLKVHPAPDQYIIKDSIRMVLSHLMEFEGATISKQDWETRVRHALIPIGCGHTYMLKKSGKKKGKKVNSERFSLPFSVFCSRDEIWITGGVDSSKTSTIAPGTQIYRINGRRTDDILAQLRKHQPSDGYNSSFQERFLNRDLFFNYLFMKYMSADSVQTIAYRKDSLGGISDEAIHCIPEAQLVPQTASKDSTIVMLYATKNKEQNFYYQPGHNNIGVLRIASFGGRKGADLYRKAITELNKNATPYLVIDLRDNTGGNFMSSVNLIRYLSDRPVKMTLSRRLFRSWAHLPLKYKLARVHSFLGFDIFNYHPRTIRNHKVVYWYNFKPSKKHHYRGQVFVLVNGMSFSASSQTATYLKEQSNAIIIGQETGGGAQALNGMQIPVYKLPESKFMIHVPQYHLDYRMGADKGHGVHPDISTSYNIQDILKKSDLEWQVIYDWIEHH